MKKFNKALNCAASIGLIVGALTVGSQASAVELKAAKIQPAQVAKIDVLTDISIIDTLANNNNNNNNNNNSGSGHHNNNNNNNNNNNRLLSSDFDRISLPRTGFRL